MIYEIRTYQLRVGSLAEVQKRFGAAYEHGQKYSPLAAFWHTEFGPLNEIVHVWPYADLKRWELKIGERTKLSPLVLAGHVEFGEANRFIHIWAYETLDQRTAIRRKARETGVWPPPGGGETLLTQANKILLPAWFSPVR